MSRDESKSISILRDILQHYKAEDVEESKPLKFQCLVTAENVKAFIYVKIMQWHSFSSELKNEISKSFFKVAKNLY